MERVWESDEQVIWNAIAAIGGKLEVRWEDSLFGNAHVPN